MSMMMEYFYYLLIINTNVTMLAMHDNQLLLYSFSYPQTHNLYIIIHIHKTVGHTYNAFAKKCAFV